MQLTVATIIIILSAIGFLATHVIFLWHDSKQTKRTCNELWKKTIDSDIENNDIRVHVRYIKEDVQKIKSSNSYNYVAIKRIERKLGIETDD